MSVPRKFSEKIAIQRQKAAEQEEAFASIMREVASARHPSIGVNVRHMNSLPSNIMYKGGSLPAFPTPHPEVQNHVGDIIQDLSATFPSRVLYDDQAYRNKQHPSRVLHKPRQRTDSSPYHLPQYETLRDSGSWRRTFSDPAMGPPRGSPSPKVSPKEPRSPQSIGKGPDTTQVYGNSMGQERKTHHMKILNNSGSLPDVASLSLEIPRSPVEVEEALMKSPHANNNIKFTVPSSIPPRRNLNTGKQVFPRQFSNPDSKEMAKEQQQRFLINQLAQEMQGNPLHSPTSPASSMAPPFGSISPLAYEAMYTQNSMPNISPSSFEQEQYLNMLRMNELMYEQANKQMPRYDESQQRQQQQMPQQQQPQQQQTQHHQQQQQQQQQVGMMQANMQNKMMQNRQMNVNQNNDEFASQFRMGITGNPEQRDDLSDDILNNIRVGLDPLNFEDYQLLANSNLEVADQNVEEQFRQDRINFP